MPEINITISSTGPKQDVTLLNLEGSIDAYNSELLSTRLNELIDKGFTKIVVNCSKLKFISSSGMGVFLAIEDDVTGNNGGLKFAAVPETILNVFQKVGLSDLFRIYATETLAVEDFTKGI